MHAFNAAIACSHFRLVRLSTNLIAMEINLRNIFSPVHVHAFNAAIACSHFRLVRLSTNLIAMEINLRNIFSPVHVHLTTKYFSDIFILKTSHN